MDAYQYMNKVARAALPPLIVTVAITGISGKETNPNVPETPDEQAREAHRAYQAGASSVHVHGRDETGARVVADPVRYREINRKIRALCPDIIIGNTTGFGPDVPREEAINVLDAEAELCSLNMGPVCFRFAYKERKPPLKGRDKDSFIELIQPFGFSEQERIAKICLEKNIKPELEIYNDSMFYALQNLIAKDLITKPYWMQLIFAPNFMPPTLEGLAHAMNMVPPESNFSVIGIGPFQLPVAAMSIAAGGHVRVGLEDNLYYAKGKFATNVQLVEAVVRIARELGREIATPAQAREIMGLSKTPRKF